jgi:hypothetical protein
MSVHDLRPIPTQALSAGGGGGGSVEARLAKIESDVDHIKLDIGEIKTNTKDLREDLRADFRWLLGLMIAGFAALASLMVGLAGLMAKNFHWIT